MKPWEAASRAHAVMAVGKALAGHSLTPTEVGAAMAQLGVGFDEAFRPCLLPWRWHCSVMRKSYRGSAA